MSRVDPPRSPKKWRGETMLWPMLSSAMSSIRATGRRSGSSGRARRAASARRRTAWGRTATVRQPSSQCLFGRARRVGIAPRVQPRRPAPRQRREASTCAGSGSDEQADFQTGVATPGDRRGHPVETGRGRRGPLGRHLGAGARGRASPDRDGVLIAISTIAGSTAISRFSRVRTVSRRRARSRSMDVPAVFPEGGR